MIKFSLKTALILMALIAAFFAGWSTRYLPLVDNFRTPIGFPEHQWGDLVPCPARKAQYRLKLNVDGTEIVEYFRVFKGEDGLPRYPSTIHGSLANNKDEILHTSITELTPNEVRLSVYHSLNSEGTTSYISVEAILPRDTKGEIDKPNHGASIGGTVTWEFLPYRYKKRGTKTDDSQTD